MKTQLDHELNKKGPVILYKITKIPTFFCCSLQTFQLIALSIDLNKLCKQRGQSNFMIGRSQSHRG